MSPCGHGPDPGAGLGAFVLKSWGKGSGIRRSCQRATAFRCTWTSAIWYPERGLVHRAGTRRVFNGGGGGGSIGPPKTGWVGIGKRAQLKLLISDCEVWRRRRRQFFWPLKMVNPPPPPTTTKSMANDDFSDRPRRADSKNPIFIFRRISGPGHLQGPGVSLGRILGGLSVEPFGGGGGALSTRPLQVETQRLVVKHRCTDQPIEP